MIQKLRKKLIAATMLALALVLLVILGGSSAMSYYKAVSDADNILTVLSENNGKFPKPEDNETPLVGTPNENPGETPAADPGEKKQGFSAETPYESRYFSVTLNESGEVTASDTGSIAAVDTTAAETLAQQIWSTGKQQGITGNYRYLRTTADNGCQIIFLDVSRSLNSWRTNLVTSILVAFCGLGAVFVLLLIFSGHIVRPVAESYDKQKRFITDAGHEIKTPLTIIGADSDLLELDIGENEWLADIKRQTERLTSLTQELIYLARMDEAQPQLQPIEFPVSDVTEELCQSFQNLAAAQEKTLDTSLTDMLSFTGDEKAIRQLISILLDNAVKYAPTQGQIAVELAKDGHFLRLSVENDTMQPLEKESLSHLFDRFYRTDASRNSSVGGYGLGLSIARSIVTAHKGKIRADQAGPERLRITVLLPA